MYEKDNKRYILKLSSGNTMMFFFKQGQGVCCSLLGRDEKWQEPSLIHRTENSYFSLCTGKAEDIHILCHDSNGSIIYLYNSGGEWTKKQILVSRRQPLRIGRLQTVHNGIRPFFFYELDYPDKKVLICQTLQSGDSPSEPAVICYLSGDKFPIFSAPVKSDNIYVFYKALQGTEMYIGCRSVDSSPEHRSGFRSLLKAGEGIELISVVLEASGVLHLCTQKKVEKGYALDYSKFSSLKGSLLFENRLCTSSVPFDKCSLLTGEDSFSVYWLNQNKVSCVLSEDSGKTWSTEQSFTLDNSLEIYCVSYFDTGTGYYIPAELPAVIDEGFIFVFDSYFSPSPKPGTLSTADKLAAGNAFSKIDELALSFKKFEEYSEKLYSRLLQIEIGMEKLSIKQSALEAGLSKVKTAVDDLKNFRSAPVKSHDVVDPVKVNPDSLPSGKAESRPIMPGIGFEGITAEFLKSLSLKK